MSFALFVFALVAQVPTSDAGAASEEWLEVSARAEVPDGGIGVGEPIHVVIEATHAPGGVALLPEELPLDASKLAERRAARKHVRAGSKAKEIDRYELEVLAFESGEVELPAIPLAYGSTKAATRPIALEVKTGFAEAELPVATSTRPEAMGELEKMAAQDPGASIVLVDDYLLLWIGGGVVLAGLIAFFAWRYLASRSKAMAAVEEERGPPPRPAHEVALERIARLRASRLIEDGRLKEVYVELSELLRAYVGGRYGFDSLDLTVGELMVELGRVHAPGLDAAKVEALLEGADLVKFAKFLPQPAEAISAINATEKIVLDTRPVEPVAGAGSPGAPAPNPSREARP